MLNKVRVKVFGKVNLSLNITGKRGNLHTLDSVLASVSVADIITVKDRLDDKVNLIFNADFVPQNNTVIKAVNALRTIFGPFGVDIVVEKNLPLSGGMGGSSADAAGVISALNALFDFDKRGLDIRSLCGSIGADVFYMLGGGYARMTDTGCEVSRINCSRRLGMVYITSKGVDTGEVYAAYDKVGGDGRTDNDKLIEALVSGKEAETGNMLYRAATSLSSEIRRNYELLEKFGFKANMTGSGSTVYALCDDPQAAVKKIAEMGVEAHCAFTEPKGIVYL